MSRRLIYLIGAFLFISCSQFNKGVIDKKTLRKKKTPSMRIAEEYDRKSNKKNKVYKNPKQAEKARRKRTDKVKKRGDKYVKKRTKHLK